MQAPSRIATRLFIPLWNRTHQHQHQYQCQNRGGSRSQSQSQLPLNSHRVSYSHAQHHQKLWLLYTSRQHELDFHELSTCLWACVSLWVCAPCWKLVNAHIPITVTYLVNWIRAKSKPGEICSERYYLPSQGNFEKGLKGAWNIS